MEWPNSLPPPLQTGNIGLEDFRLERPKNIHQERNVWDLQELLLGPGLIWSMVGEIDMLKLLVARKRSLFCARSISRESDLLIEVLMRQPY